MRVLFQGDSITEGGRQEHGDLNHAMGQGYPLLVSAALSLKFPNTRYNFVNKGVSGNSCAQLCGRWQEDTLNLKPDVVSILIGTNDAGIESRSEDSVRFHGMEYALDLLLLQTRQVLPNTSIILLEPFLLDSGNMEKNLFDLRFSLLRDYQNMIFQKAQQYDVRFVPLQKRFEKALQKAPASYWLWDSVHPTYAGHALIADAFLNDTQDIFNARS